MSTDMNTDMSTDAPHEAEQPAGPDLRYLWVSEETYTTLSEIVDAAHAALDTDVLEFLDSGAGDEVTLRRNRDAFARWAFRPRAMSGRPVPSTATTFLGIPLALPVLTAPFGGDRLFHPEGHVAVARANATEGVASIVPEIGSFALEELAAAAPAAARLAQLHPMGPPDNFVAMLGRIERAGYQAVCVTVDAAAYGWRDRVLRRRFSPDMSVGMGNYPPDGDFTLEEVFGAFFTRDQPAWSWEQLSELMAETTLPWIAKGILTGKDAELAAAAGASGVVVSNQGGRQLDGAPGALDQLPEVAAAVGGQLQIALDSGIRRGSDIVTAVALGADVVVLGRLAAYGLAAGGEPGVRRVLQLLRDEIVTVLILLGRGDISELDRTALQLAR
jgi:isopentenyl diphosphate isomerase/L-lactate dehydrogenase-like FMN-dependent dehydrogenase